MPTLMAVISLPDATERLATFTKLNAHLPLVHLFPAVQGWRLDRDQLIDTGLITADNTYSAGALGCAMSHVSLWRHCVERNEPMTIVEDDAILRHDFIAKSEHILTRCMDYHLLAWGWNTNWPALLQPGSGLPAFTLAEADDWAEPFAIDDFQTCTSAPSILGVHGLAGTPCYSITPAGAQALLRLSLPIGNATALYPGDRNRSWANGGIDVEMSRHYASLQAFACFPPMAHSPNDWNQSSIRPNERNNSEIFGHQSGKVKIFV